MSTTSVPLPNVAGIPSSTSTSSAKAAKKASSTKRKAASKADDISIPSDLLENFIKFGGTMEKFVSARDAKSEYFLTPDDLRFVDYESMGGGIGCGAPYKLFQHEDLLQVCLEKHGRDGLRKKLESRYKREAKKRQREEAAEQALLNAQKEQLTNSSSSSNKKQKTSTAAATAVGDTTEIKKLRKSLLKMAKKALGFQMSGAPKNWRIELPGTSPSTFAALMNRPQDTTLSTFVKTGAYYKDASVDASTFFAVEDEEDLVRGFRREGVSQKICWRMIVRYKPSANELSINGDAEIAW